MQFFYEKRKNRRHTAAGLKITRQTKKEQKVKTTRKRKQFWQNSQKQHRSVKEKVSYEKILIRYNKSRNMLSTLHIAHSGRPILFFASRHTNTNTNTHAQAHKHAHTQTHTLSTTRTLNSTMSHSLLLSFVHICHHA